MLLEKERVVAEREEKVTRYATDTNVWFQKISIPPPQRVTGTSKGEGGFKGQNF